MTAELDITGRRDGAIALCFPDVLPHAAVAELGLDAIAYDRLGPVLYCACQRKTAYNVVLRRRCLVTRRGVLYVIRSLQADVQERGNPSVPLVDDCTAMVDPSHIVDLARGNLSIAYHTSTRLTADNERVEHETEFVFTLIPQRGATRRVDTRSEDAPLVLQMPAAHGNTLRRVVAHFAETVPNLLITEQPCPQDSPVSPLKRLRGIVKSIRKTPSVARLGSLTSATGTMDEPSTVGRIDDPSGCHDLLRPKGLRHHAPDELVPLDALRRRPPMPPEELDAISTKLMNIYAFYAPEKAHTVPDLMLKYRGLEDLLLIKVVATYGSASSPSGTALTPLKTRDEESSGTWVEKSIVFRDISDIEALDSEEEQDSRSENKIAGVSMDEDDAENLMLEVSVLERSCDRLGWAVGASKAVTTLSPNDASILLDSRKRALAMAQIVMAICANSVKKAHLAAEDAMTAMYVNAAMMRTAESTGTGRAGTIVDLL